MSRARTIETAFAGVDELLAARVADGTEIGASLCVIHDDEVVLDTWHGSVLGPDGVTGPWRADTITAVWSTSKTMTNLALLVLVDRGLVELDAPVARYWPEFAQNGKESVLVGHVLSHSSGVPAWGPSFSVEDLLDWERSVAALAAQPTWWEPGTASGYHLIAQGHLVGEIIRRVSGLMPGDAIRAWLTEPLGADGRNGAFHLGVPDAQRQHISHVEPPGRIDLEPADSDSIAVRTATQPFLHARTANTESWWGAQVPGASGFGNARGVAEVQSLVSHGGRRHGRELLSPATLAQITRAWTDGIDLVTRIPLRFGAGWALPDSSGRSQWGGFGGSIVVNDPGRRTTVAYVMNRMVLEHHPGTRFQRPCGDSRSDEHLARIWEVLNDA